jgi:hypothetical protein
VKREREEHYDKILLFPLNSILFPVVSGLDAGASSQYNARGDR